MRLQSIVSEAIMGASQYQPPADVRKLMADFYALDLLQNGIRHVPSDRGEAIDQELQSVERVLLPHLQEHLLRKAGNAIASELSNIYDYTHIYNLQDQTTAAEWLQEHLPQPAIDILFEASNVECIYYDPDWELSVAPYYSEYVRCGLKAFAPNGPVRWANQYGGLPWYQSCVTWMELAHAKNNELRMRIDRIYQLQHNNGKLLDKNLEYNGQWLDAMLDVKYKANDPEELVKYASPFIRRLAGFVLRDSYGRSHETRPQGVIDYEDHLSKVIASAISELKPLGVRYDLINTEQISVPHSWVYPSQVVMVGRHGKLQIAIAVSDDERQIYLIVNNPTENNRWSIINQVPLFQAKPNSNKLNRQIKTNLLEFFFERWEELIKQSSINPRSPSPTTVPIPMPDFDGPDQPMVW